MKYSVLQEELHSYENIEYDFHFDKLRDNALIEDHEYDIHKIYKNKSCVFLLTSYKFDDNYDFMLVLPEVALITLKDIYFLLTKYMYPYDKYHAIQLVDDYFEREEQSRTKRLEDEREEFIEEYGYDPDNVIILYDFENTEDVIFTMGTDNYDFMEDYEELDE